jgi:two-component system probable response regulator PhcQ
MPDSRQLLVVDDEPLALKYFQRTFGNTYKVHTASSVQEALSVLDRLGGAIGVVVADQRMPGESGLVLLTHVREHYPETVGILTTAYSDVGVLVQAINTGAVFSFVSKPWNLDELAKTLDRAVASHFDRTALRMAEQSIHPSTASLDHRITEAGIIASRIGHYVNNAFCPVTFLIDQLIANHRTPGSLPLDFLKGLKKHIAEVSTTLAELEQASGGHVSSSCAPVNLECILDRVLQETSFMREQKRLAVDVNARASIPKIHGNALQIEKMCRFMIAEELVSLPADSRLSVHLSCEESFHRGPCAKLEFEDYVPLGKGLSENKLLHPFHLRGGNPKEFGVFLTSSYLIARNHGGRLSTRIKLDAGLIYSILLPAIEPCLEG